VDLDLSTVRGPYRLWFYRFGLGPESVPDTLSIGDTVSGEVIEPWGDADDFRFYGVRGQHVNIALQGLADPGGGFSAWITGPPNAREEMFASVATPTSAAALHDHQTRRMDLTATGWYHVRVSGPDGMGSPADRGAYRFAVEPLGVAPENAPSALVPGDSLTTESIDTPGDWDEFTLTATPGQEVYVLFHGAPMLRVNDPTTGDSLAARVGWQYDKLVDPVRVPAGGQVKIAAYQPGSFIRFCYDATCGNALPFVGPYAFRVFALNRGPETAPPAYTVGDTVRGEALWPVGDIDEFTAVGTPGDTLTPWYHLTADPAPAGGLISLEVVDPGTRAIIVGAGAAVYRSSTQYFSPGSFVVPTGGTFIVRVHAYGSFGDNLGTAPYEFFVMRGP
jgi:hypothetical protein